ncbi:disease resistance-like protein [Trifolium pratense]|uniref:Disease resistance-like protein n=1 Tax=Trifolium pratense TaxID=57577 RepID=A0A2K3LT10_TRIPR|nr:disease resistance-like protein [Trifolium pratense]
MESSNVQSIVLTECNLTDESLPIVRKWFANVTYLDIKVECIKELRSLTRLNLDDCKRLQEIRGIPSYLKRLSALNCESLGSSCRKMQLNQELFEVGGTMFCLPETARIPESFDHRSSGSSISFWLRCKLPFIPLFSTTQWIDNKNASSAIYSPMAITMLSNQTMHSFDDIENVYSMINSINADKGRKD